MRRAAVPLVVLALLVGGIFLWRSRGAEAPKAAPDGGATAKEDRRGRRDVPTFDPDAPAGAMEGVVLTQAGKAVPGALVAAVPTGGDSRRMAKPAGTARSDAEGHFRIENLRPGEYAATATAPGLAGAFKGELLLLPAETLRVELRMGTSGVTLSGRVFDSGGGAIGAAEVRAERMSEDKGDVFQVLADADGRYKVMLPKGTYRLIADAEGYAPEEKMEALTADASVDFKLNPAANLKGRVVLRGSGEAVAGASVNAHLSARFWAEGHTATSAADGTFEIKDLDPGEYEVSARKEALIGSLKRPVAVALAAQVEGVVVEVETARTISGIVKTAKGEPAGGARVRLGGAGFGATARGQSATAGADGGFKIMGIWPGKYRLTATKKGHASAVLDDVEIAETDKTGVELVLPDGAEISGRVATKDGRAVVGASVQAFMSSARMMGGGRGFQADKTDDAGRFKLSDLGAGKYEVTATGERGTARTDTTVAAGEKKELTLTVDDAGSVSGKVTFDDGTPAVGVSVTGFARGAGGPVRTKTGDDGSYKLSPLPAGNVFVSASRKAGGFGPMGNGGDFRSVPLEAGERKTGVDFTVDRGGQRIRGIAMGPDGKPVEGAAVAAVQENQMRAVRVRMGGMMSDGKVMTDAEGAFTCDDVGTKGLYTVTATKAGLPDARAEHVAPGATGVIVQFKKPALLAGNVQGPAGPATDYQIAAQVHGDVDERRIGAFMGGANAKQVHDSEGAFEIGGLAPGKYDVVVSTSDGRVGKQLGLQLGEGEEKRGVVIQLGKGATLIGRLVEFEGGAAVAGAQVMVAASGTPQRATTDGNGAFRVEGLPSAQPLQLTSLADFQTYVPDHREITIPEGKQELDVGSVRIVRGQMMGRMGAGVGIQPLQREGRAWVDKVTPDSAAAKAGVTPGDAILTIDDKDVRDLGSAALAYLLGGAAGTTVSVGLEHGGKKTTVSLQRTPGRPFGG